MRKVLTIGLAGCLMGCSLTKNPAASASGGSGFWNTGSGSDGGAGSTTSSGSGGGGGGYTRIGDAPGGSSTATASTTTTGTTTTSGGGATTITTSGGSTSAGTTTSGGSTTDGLREVVGSDGIARTILSIINPNVWVAPFGEGYTNNNDVNRDVVAGLLAVTYVGENSNDWAGNKDSSTWGFWVGGMVTWKNPTGGRIRVTIAAIKPSTGGRAASFFWYKALPSPTQQIWYKEGGDTTILLDNGHVVDARTR